MAEAKIYNQFFFSDFFLRNQINFCLKYKYKYKLEVEYLCFII